ncbi:unnamed protein product [Rotaria sp. Silwood2]|nr:unnamed protein product [Rotaria sp. Silwood2]
MTKPDLEHSFETLRNTISNYERTAKLAAFSYKASRLQEQMQILAYTLGIDDIEPNTTRQGSTRHTTTSLNQMLVSQ